MQLSHSSKAVSVRFDDPNLVSAAGLVPTMRLATSAGLQDLADEHLSVPTDKGANPGLKIASLVAGMVAGVASQTSWQTGFEGMIGVTEEEMAYGSTTCDPGGEED